MSYKIFQEKFVVKLQGGLGNQLFQYSFAEYLRENLNADVRFDTFEFVPNFHHKGLLLHKLGFDISSKIQNSNYLINKYRIHVLKRLSIKLGIDIGYYTDKYNDIYSSGYYDGYWQSLKYSSMIVDKVKFNNLPFDAGLLNLISSTESCSIHMRFGDYLSESNKKIYCSQDSNYYLNSIKFILNNNPNSKFFVFSDQPNLARNILKSIEYDFVIIDPDKKIDDPILDFFYMSNCKSNIITNSTFGWWAALVASRKSSSGIRIFPNNWYIDAAENRKLIDNLCPNDWHQF